MERAQDAAADDAREQGRRGDDRKQKADPGALPDAALAELVGLDLAVVVEDEDAKRVELDVVVGLVPALELLDGVVSGRLVAEERQHDCLCCHSDPSLSLHELAPGGARTTAVTTYWWSRSVRPTRPGESPIIALRGG